MTSATFLARLLTPTFCALAMSGAVPAAAQTVPDPDFGTGGVLTLDLGAGSVTPTGLVKAPDGSLLVAGGHWPNGGTQYGFVMRLTADGAVDAGFGTNGKASFELGGFTAITALARQADGALVAAANNGVYATTAIRVIRLTPNGVPDATFSGDGVAEVSTDHGVVPVAVAVQGDGKVVVAVSYGGRPGAPASGLTVFRLLADGSLDTDFGQVGSPGFAIAALSSSDAAAALVVQPDGRIVVVGSTNTAGGGNAGTRDLAIARFNADGTPDLSFDGDGKRGVPVGALDDDGLAVVLQPDGKIVVGGHSYASSSRSNCALLRFHPDGSLDGTFGLGGMTVYNLGGLSTCTSLTRQGDGALVAAGAWADNIDAILMVMRVLPDGQPDTTFNSGASWAWVNPSPGSDGTVAHVAQSGGKLVLLGRVGFTGAMLARFKSNAPDTTPDPFAFTDQTNVPRGAVVVSDAVTVNGLGLPASISVTGGEYAVDGAPFTTAAGTITNGATVRVRHTASLHPAAVTATTLTVGDLSDTFTSTTTPPRIRSRVTR